MQGVYDNTCHCPHWGYFFEGSARLKYDDGSEEVTRAGEVLYWNQGHTTIVEEDLKLVDFSPEKELGEVMEHIGRKMEEMG